MNNKNKITVLGVVFVSMVIASCLKVNPKDTIFADNFFQTSADYRSAYVGVYATLIQDATYSRNLWAHFDWSNDELVENRPIGTNPMLGYSYDAADPNVNDTWQNLYNGIERANGFLANLKNLSDSLSYYAAEVRFLRGYFYFLLDQHWGSVPVRGGLYSSANGTNIDFQPVDSVYSFAINDMLTAYPRLQTIQKTGAGRISQTTCAGILARVNLYAASYCYDADKPAEYKQVKGRNFEAQFKNISAKYFYEQAKRWADTVMIANSAYYNATGITGITYAKIFANQSTNQYYTQESMWEVEFYGNRAGTYANSYTAGRVGVYNGVFVAAGGAGYAMLSPYIISHSDTANDLRFKRNAPFIIYTATSNNTSPSTLPFTTVPRIYNSLNNTCSFGKWRRSDENLTPLNANYNAVNFPVLRYADVVFMAAEASNELMMQFGAVSPDNAGDIVTQMKAIKQRAGIAQNIPALGTQAMRDTIRVERMRELVGEGLRKQDLIRWGIYLSQVNTTLGLYSTYDQTNKPYGTTVDYGTNYSVTVLRNIVNGGVKYLIQPVPQTELNLNKAPTAVQHPLWQ